MDNKYVNECRNRIRELRIAKGHDSMREFVRFINGTLGYDVSVATISLLESHRRENPSWELIDCLCKYFGVTSDYLMGRSDYNIEDKEVKEVVAKDKEPLPPEMQMEMDRFYEKMRQMYVDRKKA